MGNFDDAKCSFCNSENGKIGSSLRNIETLEVTENEFSFICMECGKTSSVYAKIIMPHFYP